MPYGSAPSRPRSPTPRERAFERLYREHYAFVWRCLQRLGVRTEAEDAVQEVFITAYRRLHTYEGRSSMRSWLAGITRKIAFRARRTDQRRQRRHDALTPPSNPTDLESWLRRKEAAAFLDAFLDGLDPQQRSVFVLCELEGLRGRQAAAALGVNQNTAYARLRAARSAFEKACTRAQSDGFDIDARRVHAAHQQPPPERAIQRGWVALVAQAGIEATAPLGSATALASVMAQAKVATITVLVGASTLGLVRLATNTDASPDQGQSRLEAGVEPPPAPSPPATTPTARAPALDTAPSASPELQSVAHVRPPPESPTPRDASGSARTAPMPTPPAAESGRQPGHRSDGLSQAEYTRLDRARAAYREGRLQLAADLAQALLREFPDGYLASDARVVLVKSHCALEHPDLAQTAAAGLGASERDRLLHEYCGARP
ncbi:MAG: sigma-70 family RNA polymerase sigma factor [Deltaproteobacteria bacterium]|nr:sigma-70 family RNA polymerase sigma factor [Deltaproteobacteria bacterium]